MTNIIKAPLQEPQSFEQMQKQAAILLKSGFLPKSIQTPEQAITIMLTGKELRLGAMESLRSINVIQGKPCMSAQLLLGLCHRTKQVEKAFVKESTEQKCVFILQRKGSPEYISTFTIDEANKAKFSQAWDKDKQAWKTKDNWEKQPATMLQWRAIAKACRVVFPDAVSGVYTEEEISDEVVLAPNKVNGQLEVEETVIYDEPGPAQLPGEVIVNNDNIVDDDLSNAKVPSKKYPNMTLGQIASQATDAGRASGIEYLQSYYEKATKPDIKNLIGRFLQQIKMM